MNFDNQQGIFNLSYSQAGTHFPKFDTKGQLCSHCADYDDYHHTSNRDTTFCTDSKIDDCLQEFESKENIEYDFDDLKLNHTSNNTQNKNNDDIILSGNDVFYIECKNSYKIECKPFLQLINGRASFRERYLNNTNTQYNEYLCIAKSMHANGSKIKGSFASISLRPKEVDNDFVHTCKNNPVLISYKTILDPDYIKEMINHT